MATRQTDLQRNMAFGQAVMINATPDEDMKENTDFFIDDFRIAYRKRRLPVNRYGQISIRYSVKSGGPTEREKILSGASKAHLYIFEFTDAWVMCKLDDIKTLLLNGPTKVVQNHDGQTEAVYINITDLPCLVINKEQGHQIKIREVSHVQQKTPDKNDSRGMEIQEWGGCPGTKDRVRF